MAKRSEQIIIVSLENLLRIYIRKARIKFNGLKVLKWNYIKLGLIELTMRRRESGRQTGSSSKEDQSPESKHRHPCHVNNHKWTNWDSLNASGKTNNLTGGLLFGNSKSWPLYLWEWRIEWLWTLWCRFAVEKEGIWNCADSREDIGHQSKQSWKLKWASFAFFINFSLIEVFNSVTPDNDACVLCRRKFKHLAFHILRFLYMNSKVSSLTLWSIYNTAFPFPSDCHFQWKTQFPSDHLQQKTLWYTLEDPKGSSSTGKNLDHSEAIFREDLINNPVERLICFSIV